MFYYNKKEKQKKMSKTETSMEEIEALIKKNEAGYKAKITAVNKTTSEDYFGKTKYEDREGYEVVFQLLDQPDIEWSEFFNIPKPTGLDDSKIMRFKNTYETLPKTGLEVFAVIIDGYFKVKL